MDNTHGKPIIIDNVLFKKKTKVIETVTDNLLKKNNYKNTIKFIRVSHIFLIYNNYVNYIY